MENFSGNWGMNKASRRISVRVIKQRKLNLQLELEIPQQKKSSKYGSLCIWIIHFTIFN